jgi:hypothetical protein
VTVLLASLVVYVLLCALGMAAGLALLELLYPGLPPWLRIFLAPTTCLALWAVCLGGGVAMGLPLRFLVGPLWAATLVLAAFGAWSLGRRRWASELGRDPARFGLLALATALPVAALWPFFWYGLSDYPGSIAPDGWSYVAYGQYLWSHHRFQSGGLAPLYEYAAHLSPTRHVSASLLQFFGGWNEFFVPTLPDEDAQTGVGVLFAWALYAFGTACAGAGLVAGLRTLWLAVYLLLAVHSGWTGNLLYANNFDHAIALAFFPALVTLLAVAPPGAWRPAVHLGLVAAGLLYTYVEMVPLVGATLLFASVHRWLRDRLPPRAWCLTLGLAAGVALLLMAPYLRSVVVFLESQFRVGLAVRPGGTAFDGLVALRHHPSAFWALGGEHRATSLLVPRLVLGGLLSLAAASGIWALARQRAYTTLFTAALVVAAFGILAFKLRYGYGASKMLIMGWWSIALLPVVGVARLAPVLPKARTYAAALVFAGLWVLASAFHQGAVATRDFASLFHNTMRHFRSVAQIEGIVGRGGVLLAVDDPWANEWAVHFLRDVRLRVGSARSYMTNPGAAAQMKQASPVPLEELVYALTDDRVDGGLGWRSDGRPIWAAGPYRLWRLPRPWAVIVDIENTNGVESRAGRTVLWLGAGTTALDVLAERAATLNIGGAFGAGPSAPDLKAFRLLVSTDGGHRQDVTVPPGPGVITVPIRRRLNRITLRPLDPPTRSRASAADPRTLIVALLEVRIWTADPPSSAP